jgi:hypothetical protein
MSKAAKKVSSETPPKKVKLSKAEASPSPTSGGAPDPTESVILNYDGDNFSAIGLNNGGEMKVAAVFTPNEVGPYIGMELTDIEVYINEGALSTKAQIYDYGLANIPGPGDLITEQDWIPTPMMWQTATLNDPVLIAGGDIWVGYLVDHDPGTFPAGTDEGPHHPNGDWISTGPGWSHLSDNPALDYNWNIRAYLSGDPIIQWLSVSPSSGTVAVGENTDISVDFDATGLDPDMYYAELVFNNNDPESSQLIVPVTLDVLTGVNEFETSAVMIYPNPVVSNLNIKADAQIRSVELLNLMGQSVYKYDVNAETHQINTSDLNSGIYMIKVDLENSTLTRKININ